LLEYWDANLDIFEKEQGKTLGQARRRVKGDGKNGNNRA
jgi:hypothetical protein